MQDIIDGKLRVEHLGATPTTVNFTYRWRDDEGSAPWSATTTATVTPLELNDAPTELRTPVGRVDPETPAGETKITDLVALDEEQNLDGTTPANGLTYELVDPTVGDARYFVIRGNELFLRSVTDLANQGLLRKLGDVGEVYDLNIRVTDTAVGTQAGQEVQSRVFPIQLPVRSFDVDWGSAPGVQNADAADGVARFNLMKLASPGDMVTIGTFNIDANDALGAYQVLLRTDSDYLSGVTITPMGGGTTSQGWSTHQTWMVSLTPDQANQILQDIAFGDTLTVSFALEIRYQAGQCRQSG